MNNYWNWYFECPYCEDEVDCHVEVHLAPDRNWVEAELPDECPSCDARLVEDWPTLEEETNKRYEQYHSEPPEVELWELERH